VLAEDARGYVGADDFEALWDGVVVGGGADVVEDAGYEEYMRRSPAVGGTFVAVGG